MLDDAWRAVVELAASQHRAFTRAQAAAKGIDHRRLRAALDRGFIVQHGPNVFTLAASPDSLLERLRVATMLGPGSFASHRSAATLFGFLDRPVAEVSVVRSRRLEVPAGLGVVVHHVKCLDRADVTTFAGIPCTTKARTLADLGSVVDFDDVTKALISANAAGISLQLCVETAQRLHRPGQKGTGMLLRALTTLQRAGVVPESWLEEVLRRILADVRLPPLVSQYRLLDRHGILVARFDHAFPDARVAVEGHSRRFHFGPVAESIDEDRDLRAARHGWEIVYLGWYVQRRPADVVEALLDVVSHRIVPPAA